MAVTVGAKIPQNAPELPLPARKEGRRAFPKMAAARPSQEKQGAGGGRGRIPKKRLEKEPDILTLAS